MKSLGKPAAPVLKWAGGKRRLLAQYEPHFPTKFGNYFEPFIGGGALFFWLFGRKALEGKQVILNDINPELVNFYRVLQSEPEELISRLAYHAKRHGEEYYYKVRKQNPYKPVNRAARILYLNRTCFNGLFRVNSKGRFNVPIGRYKNPLICDREGLLTASLALSKAEVSHGSFELVTKAAQSGDLVYFDPPYVPLNATSSFTSYAKENFGLAQQEALAQTFQDLATRGVQVLLSNSDTPLVRELYEGYEMHQIMAPRAINSKADRRQKVSELLIISK